MKKYYIVVILVLPLLILVSISTFRTGRFRHDAARWASPSVDQTNLITLEQLNSFSPPLLVVRLDESPVDLNDAIDESIIPAERILEKQNQRRLRAFKGSIVLVAGDPALSARVWMLLKQMGYEDLYMLSDTVNNEELKYKFQPDTLTGLEL